MGSEAMFINGMEDLDDFGTDKEEEDQRPRGKRAARADSDKEDGDEEPVRTQSRPVSKTAAAPEQPTSKRKRVSDTSDRTSKRTRVIKTVGSGGLEGGSPSNGSTGEKEDDAMDQDSQGEETLEVEQNLFCPSDEDPLTVPRWACLFHINSGELTFLRIAQRFPWDQHTETVYPTASVRQPSGVYIPELAHSSTS